jgi:uracil-DNA glycosylase
MTPLLTPPHAYQHHYTNDIDVITEWNVKGKFMYVILNDSIQRRKQTNDNQKENDDADDDDYQRSIWITLGMTGQFLNEASHLMDPSFCRWYMELMDVDTEKDGNQKTSKSPTPSTYKIYYHDQRNFGTLKFSLSRSELDDKLNSLGPDILSVDEDGFPEETFLQIVSKQRPTTNVCKFLMDQSKVSGIGNYILSEVLYRANIDPYCALQELTVQQQRVLYQEIVAVASESYRSNGMTRVKGGSYQTVDGQRGQYVFELQCYGRTTCPKGRTVIRDTDGPHGRTIWYTDQQLLMPREQRQGITDTALDEEKNGRQNVSDVTITSKTTTPVPSTPSLNREDKSITFDNLLDGLTEPSWRGALQPYTTTSESFQRLQKFLQEEQSHGVTIYPPPSSVFSALNLCPLNQTKVVVLGQDPYHGPNQGTGLAFSVNRGIPIPPSLKNIFKEATDDVGIQPPEHGDLECWARQGVLLLNTVLTVRRGQANSHARYGWEDFTDEIVRILNEPEGDKRVFLLWGLPAAQKAKAVDPNRHVVITTSHPSPLGATKTKTPFLTSRCFSRANQALIDMGKEPIDWNVR